MTDRYEKIRQALEYASDLTKVEDLQGCTCPICTSITAIKERLK